MPYIAVVRLLIDTKSKAEERRIVTEATRAEYQDGREASR